MDADRSGSADGSRPSGGGIGTPPRSSEAPQDHPTATSRPDVDDPVPASIARSLDARRALARKRAAAAAARLATPPTDQAASASLRKRSKTRLEALHHDLERPGSEPIVLAHDDP